MLYAGFVVSLLLVAMACAWFELTPMASVVDTRLAALIAGATAAALAGWRLRRSRRVGWWCALLLGLGTAAVAAVLAFGLVREDDVRFQSNGARLAGTLFLPRGSGPYPAVVFIHGAGREVRREFEYHARLFARHGIAGFVYDKRGAGESGGSTYDADYFGYASDAAAAIRYLRSRQDIAGPCVGIYGHSEGGWVASIVASQAAPDVRFVIVTSTTDLSPARQVLFETGARAGVGQAVELQKRVLQYQRSGTADPALASDLRAAARQPWFASAELPDQLYPIEEYAWWRRVMDFDAPS
ncbi:MAG TPA: alpha/beta fold hydrolase, partial [Thermoanaerobaculia bacterium]